MSERKKLIEINYHSDDDTGMHEVGEVDYSIPAELDRYIAHYGHEGVQRIMTALGQMAHRVWQSYYALPPKEYPESNSCNTTSA